MPARIETVHINQPPASLARTPEEMAWLEQVARILNTLVSSGGAESEDFAPWRPTTLLYPGRFFFDTHPDVAPGGTPIWRNTINTGWVNGIGDSI